MSRTEWSVVSGQWSVTGGQFGDCPNFRVSENGTVALGVAYSRPGRVLSPSLFRLPPSRPVARAGFTLVEMLVTIAIIAIMAGLVFGALQAARATAREAATKATIAKLNNIIMARYESYLTRRIPLSTQGLSATAAARLRLYAIRDLMRMEMPDRVEDVTDDPIQITADGKTFQMRRPALSQLYNDRLENSSPGTGTGVANGQAELLYMIVSMGSPEAMEQFSQSEIGDTNKNGYPEFLDGWGRPIFFLRWAPGFSSYSAIQSDNAVTNHDPFDPLRTESNAYRLLPLIYSGGPSNGPDLIIGEGYHFGDTNSPGSMFSDANAEAFGKIGTLKTGSGKGNITNHQIEQR